MEIRTSLRAALAAIVALCAGSAQADITVGVSFSLTGPASGLGIPCKNGLALWPDFIAGEKVKLIVLDDASDPSQASKNARRLIAEDKVDVILGSTATPAAAAMAEVTAEGQTVQLAERGYKGKIYQTHSAASRDLLRLGGKDVEGAFVIASLAVIPEALPDSHPSKQVAIDFVQRYEKQFGAGSRNRFAAHAYDANLILQRVVPEALKKGRPGTPEFRAALKQALENAGNMVITQGVIHYTPTDHFGLGSNARMLLTVENGNWKALTQ